MKLALYIKDIDGKEPKMFCWLRGAKARKVMAALLDCCWPKCVDCDKAKKV